jgi:hypothetical protein
MSEDHEWNKEFQDLISENGSRLSLILGKKYCYKKKSPLENWYFQRAGLY